MCIFAMDMWSNCMWMWPTLWVAEWSLIVQGRPKNTIYQDDETYVNMIPKLRIKCHSISRGFNLCLPAEGAYFISTVAQTGNAFSWHEKSPNCVHIITKMAVKPVYTYHAEKNLPCGTLYRIFNTYITNKTVLLFCHHIETYYAKPNLI